MVNIQGGGSTAPTRNSPLTPCHTAGRDLSFLIASYLGNMVLVMASLFAVQRANMGVLGSFMCLCQFQTTRLVLNAVRLSRSRNSPLRSTETLKPWITEDLKVAAA